MITRLFRRVLPVLLLALLLLCAAAAAWVYGEYREFTAPPTTRLSTDTQYQDAPASDRLHYLQHPLDHDDPAAGSFTGFYWLSPGFTPGDGVVFFLTDGQQPLVNQYGASDVLEQRLQGVSYVAIGRRGHAPTLFPEVYSASGALDHSLALDLYSSWQHVEDIERVRLDLLRLGYLPDSGQIMLMGGSGAGLLVQQYLSRYGHNVSRALLEVSGAPDLAAQNPALAAQSPALGTGHALDRLRLSHPTALDTLGQLLGDDSCHRCGHHDTDCSEGARGARRPSGGEDGGEGPCRARFGGEEPVFPPQRKGEVIVAANGRNDDGSLDRAQRRSLLFTLQRLPYEILDADDAQADLIASVQAGHRMSLLRYQLNPKLNYRVVSFILGVPSMDAARVRMFELLGPGLLAYGPSSDLDLLYEWMTPVLADFVALAQAGRLEVPIFDLTASRGGFEGEVLVVSAQRDHVYGTEPGRLLHQAYPDGRWAVFDDNHRMMSHPDFYSAMRAAFFESGLHSPELDGYLMDPLQLRRD